MCQWFASHFVLMWILFFFFAFCITKDNAGVVLRNFKSRRTIMEELEREEERHTLNFTNLKNASNKTSNFMMDLRNFNSSFIKSPNISKNLKTISKKKIPSQKSVVVPQTTNKTQNSYVLTNSVVEYAGNRGKRMEESISKNDSINKSRKLFLLPNSFVEYVGNRGKRMEESISENDNINKSRKSFLLPNSFVEYVGNRGKRMEDTVLASDNDTSNWTLKSQLNESSPFRLISHVNDQMSENSSLLKTGDLDEKEMSQLEQEEIFTILRELDKKQTTENGQLITEKVKENINDVSENWFPHEKENNDSIIPEVSESPDLENVVSANHRKNSELNIPPSGLISGVHIEEQSKNFPDNTTEDNKKSLDDIGIVNQVLKKETKDNESSIEHTVSVTEEDMMVKPFELKKSSDIIEETSKEIAEIIPEFNQTIAIANIEEFVVNLTDTVQNMPDEIINLKPEQISQSMQKEDTVTKNVSATILNDTHNEFELSLESVVSSGFDFIVNSEVGKNAAMAMEMFNLSDSSLADHVIEDSDMHSFLDVVMPSVSLSETEPIPKDRETIISKETIISNSSAIVVENNLTLDPNSMFNSSLVIQENVIDSSAKSNATSAAAERKCPTPGICVFWFMARDTCSDHSQCLDGKMCCRVRCSKTCIDI